MDPRLSRVLGIVAAIAAIVVIVVSLRSSENESNPLAGATARLVDSCVEGVEADRPLCQCIADQLVARQGVVTADGLDRAREAVEDGKRPARVVRAARACRGKI